MDSDKAVERAQRRLAALSDQLQGFESRLTSVSRTTRQATQAVGAAGKAAQAVATLLEFDEINRLKEKSAGSSGSGRKSGSGSGSGSGKVKTGPTETFDLDVRLTRPGREAAEEFVSQFRLGVKKADDGGEAAGGSLVERIGRGISNALGNGSNWVSSHLWKPIQSGWSGLGGLFVTVGARLSSSAGDLWSDFQSGWKSGTRSVSVVDVLANGASSLWQNFSALWGTRGVSIVDVLANGASQLWTNFSLLWGTRSVGIVNTLTNGASTLWTNFSLLWGTRSVGIVNTLTNGASALWANFAAVWGTRGVGIVNTLTNGASALWANFAAGWGTRGVGIVNTLTSAASTLWANFAAGWGTRSVGIVNTLVNSAASLWQQFRSGWAGRTLGLTVTYSTNVGAVKRAVYRALGLSGWPTISFAARGGVFRSATLTMLGEAGTEAVVPLENNTGWMDVMAEKLGERMGGAGTITIPVYIGGEKLAEAVVEAVNAETRRTGVSPLYL